jgi:hypothetical protein
LCARWFAVCARFRNGDLAIEFVGESEKLSIGAVAA